MTPESIREKRGRGREDPNSKRPSRLMRRPWNSGHRQKTRTAAFRLVQYRMGRTLERKACLNGGAGRSSWGWPSYIYV